MKLRPSEIFYSQDSIMNRFGDYTPHGNTYIGETLDRLLNGHCNVESIPNIRVVQWNGKWFIPDNRRLWVFRTAEEIGFLKSIYVIETYNRKNNKFTTKNGGASIRVRGSERGSLWRTWKPKRTHVNYNSNRVFSPYSDEDVNANVNTYNDIDDNNPDIAQNNEWNKEVPSLFNSNVETRVLVEHDDSYIVPDEDKRCCIIL